MTTKIARWGNSLAVRLPKNAVAGLGLADGMPVEVRTDKGRLIVIPQKGPNAELARLVARITPKNRHAATDWGPPVGGEVW